MKLYLFLLLGIYGFVAARPKFSRTPVKGKVNYSSKPLKEGIVTLDDDLNIQAIKCTGSNMSTFFVLSSCFWY